MSLAGRTGEWIKAWHIWLLATIVLAAAVFFGVRFVQTLPAKPLVISPSGLSSAELAAAKVAIQPFENVRFIDAPLTQIHHRITRLSWVQSAKVSRHWQHGVLVEISPRQAVANFGSDRLLDAHGVAFVPADEALLMNAGLSNLYGDPAQAGQIMQQMRRVNEWFAGKNLQVQDLILTPRQTWVIRFNTGLRVVVDHENTEQKLYTLAALLGSSLADDLPKMQSVDLRYKNGMAIAWKE